MKTYLKQMEMIANDAIENLKEKGVDARYDTNTESLYVIINDVEIEVSETEVMFQYNEYHERLKNGYFN